MSQWTKLFFGKHKGKTLPQVLFSDPEWFFWAYEEGVFKGKGTLTGEASKIYTKARNIKIPDRFGEGAIVDYIIHKPTGKFGTIRIENIYKDYLEETGAKGHYDYIDMNFPRQITNYDKRGYVNMLKALKSILFGNVDVRLTKKRCEEFFSEDNNFI